MIREEVQKMLIIDELPREIIEAINEYYES